MQKIPALHNPQVIVVCWDISSSVHTGPWAAHSGCGVSRMAPIPGKGSCAPSRLSATSPSNEAVKCTCGRHARRHQFLSSDEASGTESAKENQSDVTESPQHEAKIMFPSPISSEPWAWGGVQPCWGTQPAMGNTPTVAQRLWQGRQLPSPRWAPCEPMVVASCLAKTQVTLQRALPWFAVDFPSLWRCPCPLSWRRGALSSQVSETGRGGMRGAQLKSNYGFRCLSLLYWIAFQLQRQALRSLRGEAILTDGGHKMLVSPCSCIRVKMKRQDKQLGWVPPLNAHVVKTKQHIPAPGPASLPVPVRTHGGLQCLPTHP